MRAPSSTELCLPHTSKGRAEVCAAELETDLPSPRPLPHPQWMLRSLWALRPSLHLALSAPPSLCLKWLPLLLYHSPVSHVSLPVFMAPHGLVCVPLTPHLPCRHRASSSAPSQGPWSNIPMRLLVVNTEAVRMEGKRDSRSLEGHTCDSEVCSEAFSPPTAVEGHWHGMWLCTCGVFLHLCGTAHHRVGQWQGPAAPSG